MRSKKGDAFCGQVVVRFRMSGVEGERANGRQLLCDVFYEFSGTEVRGKSFGNFGGWMIKKGV